MLLLSTDSLCKLYGDVIGVNDLNLSLPTGVHGLLGPNGAGKSTLLKLITGQLKPSEGNLKVLGETPWNNQRLFSKIGICPETDSFYDYLTGLEFVRFSAEIKGIPASESKAKAKVALEQVNGGKFMDRVISTYSKGMRQRTKIAQAIVADPQLVILDEPLTGTDPIARQDIINIIKRLGEQGKSVFVSSHVLHEVQAMTEQFLLIFRGRVLASGSVTEVRRLMLDYPHEVTVTSNAPKLLAQALIASTNVQQLQLSPRSVTVKTNDSAHFFSKLTELAASSDSFSIESVVSEDESLDKVFDYLVTGATP